MDNKIRDNLERQFAKLTDQEAAPERLKEEVFQTLDTATMIGDIAGLFTSAFVHTSASLIGVIQDEEQSDHSSNHTGYESDIEDSEDQSYAMEEPDN